MGIKASFSTISAEIQLTTNLPSMGDFDQYNLFVAIVDSLRGSKAVFRDGVRVKDAMVGYMKSVVEMES